MRRVRIHRAAAAMLSSVTLLALVAGPMPGDLWRASEPRGFQEDSGSGASAPGDGEAPAAMADCEWTRPPLPDSEIEIPDPADYLIPQADGALLLPNDEVEVNGHRISLPVLEDLMWIAADRGISVEEAIFRYGWQEQFGGIVERLRGEYPGELTDARIINDGCGATIGFKSAVPQLAVTLTESLPVPVELLGDLGYDEEELVDVLHAAFFPIAGHPKVADAMGGPDAATGVVTIQVQPRGDTTRADRVALCRQLRPPAPANPAIVIHLVLVEDIAGPSRSHAC